MCVALADALAEDAARPHGGGGDRELGKHDLVLVDTGGVLHGYGSDITRVCLVLHSPQSGISCALQTFALPESEIPSEHLAIWYTVLRAQSAAASAARADVRTGDVDAAARAVITDVGYVRSSPVSTTLLAHCWFRESTSRIVSVTVCTHACS